MEPAWLLLLSTIIQTVSSIELPSPIVNTKLGRVQGVQRYLDGKQVHAYLGIPYATPPVGELRFQRTVPVKPWDYLLKADKLPPACIQYVSSPFPWCDFSPSKSEDCLYLNIWVPATTRSSRNMKDVLFWIHGGGYRCGSSRLPIYDGTALSAFGDVVVVTINYRVGPLGFFTTLTEDAPGNAGIHDVVEALKWVKSNINAFGGDPNKITIAGESAGSVMVGFLTLSPLAKGLFQRGIMQSASPFYPVLESSRETNLRLSRQLANSVGCASPDTEAVVRCMKKINASVLDKTVDDTYPQAVIIFTPIFGDSVIPLPPRTAIANGFLHDIDLLIGHNRDEGSCFMTSAVPQLFGFFGHNNTCIDASTAGLILGSNLSPFPGAPLLRNIANLTDKCEIRRQTHMAMGDFIINCPTIYFAEAMSERSGRVYYYYFTQRPSTSPWAPWMGVAHYDDVDFVFGLPLQRPEDYSPSEAALSMNMIKIWSYFAKNGNPEYYFPWPKYSRHTRNFVYLDTHHVGTVGAGLYSPNCDVLRPILGYNLYFSAKSESGFDL